MICWERLCSTENLTWKISRKVLDRREKVNHLEQILPELFFLVLTLSEVLQAELTEVRVVDQAVLPPDFVWNVQQRLVGGIQTEHLHSSL